MSTPRSPSATDRLANLRVALRAADPAARQRVLQELVATAGDPDNIAAVPVLLRALARRREPERQIVEALRGLGLRRVAALIEQHLPELVAAARERSEPPDPDEQAELPALD